MQACALQPGTGPILMSFYEHFHREASLLLPYKESRTAHIPEGMRSVPQISVHWRGTSPEYLESQLSTQILTIFRVPVRKSCMNLQIRNPRLCSKLLRVLGRYRHFKPIVPRWVCHPASSPCSSASSRSEPSFAESTSRGEARGTREDFPSPRKLFDDG